jgi:hypothetical protein
MLYLLFDGVKRKEYFLTEIFILYKTHLIGTSFRFSNEKVVLKKCPDAEDSKLSLFLLSKMFQKNHRFLLILLSLGHAFV